MGTKGETGPEKQNKLGSLFCPDSCWGYPVVCFTRALELGVCVRMWLKSRISALKPLLAAVGPGRWDHQGAWLEKGAGCRAGRQWGPGGTCHASG